ncbi:MAG: protease modulator HflC [bacterium]
MKLTLPFGILALVILVIATNAFYTVDETEQVVITQFGNPVGAPVTASGLHVKLPLVQKANYFKKNILEWDGDPSQIPTLDKTFIWVDIFARWRIADPLKFLQNVTDETRAQAQLDSIINAAVRNLIQSNALIESVRDSNRTMEIVSTELREGSVPYTASASLGRGKLMRLIMEQARPKLASVGIDLVDVRMKRIMYIQDVQKKVFERMIAERHQIAEKYRSEGKGESQKIEGRMHRELKTIGSEAYRASEEIQGRADAEATRIYAESYGMDPQFYSFVKTLDLYKNLPDKEIELILGTESDLFKYLKGVGP